MSCTLHVGKRTKCRLSFWLICLWSLYTYRGLRNNYQGLELMIVQGVCSFCWNFTECQILWSLCSVDFHTLTLQLPFQTQKFCGSELQVFTVRIAKRVKVMFSQRVSLILFNGVGEECNTKGLPPPSPRDQVTTPPPPPDQVTTPPSHRTRSQHLPPPRDQVTTPPALGPGHNTSLPPGPGHNTSCPGTRSQHLPLSLSPRDQVTTPPSLPPPEPGHNNSLPPPWDQVTTPPSLPPPEPGHNNSLPPPGPGHNTSLPPPPGTRSQHLPPSLSPRTRSQHLPPSLPTRTRSQQLLPPGTRSQHLPSSSPLGPGHNTSLPPSPPGPGHNTSLPPPGPGHNTSSLPRGPGHNTSLPPSPHQDQVTTQWDYAQAGSTYPTGMHSCSYYFYFEFKKWLRLNVRDLCLL